MKTPVFNCPSCNTPVEGKADYIARGLRCPACGVGFMPVHIETRTQIGPKAKSLPTVWLYPVLALLLIGTGFISFWAAIAVAVVVLLVVIVHKLSVLTKRTS